MVIILVVLAQVYSVNVFNANELNENGLIDWSAKDGITEECADSMTSLQSWYIDS